jgi:hypothetical protein
LEKSQLWATDPRKGKVKKPTQAKRRLEWDTRARADQHWTLEARKGFRNNLGKKACIHCPERHKNESA